MLRPNHLLPVLSSSQCLSLCPLSMAARSTRHQVALGATAPVGSFDRGWGHLKVCSPSPCPLFFFIALVLFSLSLYERQGRMPPLPERLKAQPRKAQRLPSFSALAPSLFLSLCSCPPSSSLICLALYFRPRRRVNQSWEGMERLFHLQLRLSFVSCVLVVLIS